MNENDLWLKRWENREIGFNQNEVNAYLQRYFKRLNLSQGSRVFVPLCGKSIDISWLLDEGYEVIGVELSEQAIVELFDALEIVPTITKLEHLIRYSSEKLVVYVGDFFEVTAEMLGEVNAIYDRAAIVALTKEVRIAYAKHLRTISGNAPQLLLCFEYEQSLMNRTPYSVEEREVKAHYEAYYAMELLCREAIEGGFKGKIPAADVVWLLT